VEISTPGEALVLMTRSLVAFQLAEVSGTSAALVVVAILLPLTEKSTPPNIIKNTPKTILVINLAITFSISIKLECVKNKKERTGLL
jgi:hypothetical protein